MSIRSKFKTLVVLDLETTGFIQDEPKITELAMIAVNIEALERTKSDVELPRVMNKFVKCFDPVKLISSEVAEVTGLTNLMLMEYAPFNRETVIAIEAFLSDFQQPICLVAHNGDDYDFPILFHEIQNAMNNTGRPIDNATQLNYQSTTMLINEDENNLLPKNNISVQTISTKEDHYQISLLSNSCADSLAFFRYMRELGTNNDNIVSEHSKLTFNSNDMISTFEKSTPNSSITYTPSPDPTRSKQSLKLSKIYQREILQGNLHLKRHQAEHDCLMLLAILKRYLSHWLDWIEVNHHPLSYFSSSTLSRTIGTSSPTMNVNVN